MDVRDLECLAVLSEELHLDRAAMRLGIAQPALSKRVQKIEAELGIAVFERGAGGVSLTAAPSHPLAPLPRRALSAPRTAEGRQRCDGDQDAHATRPSGRRSSGVQAPTT